MTSDIIELKTKWQLGKQMAQDGFGRIYEARGEDGASAVVKLIPNEPGAARELLFGYCQDKSRGIAGGCLEAHCCWEPGGLRPAPGRR